jgi:hypothetical protein
MRQTARHLHRHVEGGAGGAAREAMNTHHTTGAETPALSTAATTEGTKATETTVPTPTRDTPATDTLLAADALHYQLGGSDKVWAGAAIRRADGTGLVLTCWGRRGAALASKATPFPTPEKAQAQHTKKVTEKQGEGYGPIDLAAWGLADTLLALARAEQVALILPGGEAGVPGAESGAPPPCPPRPRQLPPRGWG